MTKNIYSKFQLLSYITISIFLLSANTKINAETIVIDVKGVFGITATGMMEAIDSAKTIFNSSPNDTVILDLAEGEHLIDNEIVFKNLGTGNKGRLIIQGQGIDKTALVDVDHTDSHKMFRGSNIYHFALRNMAITADRIFSSQGYCKSVKPGEVIIEIHDDYPTPDELFETATPKANKMRRFTKSLTNPTYIEGPDNDHYYYRWNWDTFEHINGKRWKFFMANTTEMAPYETGDVLAISSKSDQANWGYFSGGGSDLVFENLLMTKLSRVKIRGGISNVRFTNVSTRRVEVGGRIACYASDAGPQFGHAGDGFVENIIMENCYFENTTDDGSAFQDVISGRISNNTWINGGGMLLGEGVSSNIIIKDNIFHHCPLEDYRIPFVTDGFYGAYDLQPEDNSISVDILPTLKWKAGVGTVSHNVYLGKTNPPPLVKTQNNTRYTPDRELETGTVYYWKVDEINPTWGVNVGDVLCFKTEGVAVVKQTIKGNNPKTGIKQCGNLLFIDTKQNTYTIYSLKGCQLICQNNTPIDISSLNSGVFFLVSENIKQKFYKK